MSRIQPLSDQLITQIAAGEVVERPASVVKELVENALDAGASDVAVELLGGGRDLVRIRDNGCGMDAEDALLAFQRHATSKLQRLEDLQSIGTLGFRGEALAAIAAVSEVDLRTAQTPGDGFHVRVEGGERVVAEPISHPRGTTIEVAGLFYNVPARRKFLKQATTEQRRCLEVVQAYALYHLGVAFAVTGSKDRALLQAGALSRQDPYSSLRDRIQQVFTGELAGNLVPFGDNPDASSAIWGMVGNQETVRGRKSFIFVNGRMLRDRALLSLFYRACRDEWGGSEFPSLFLFIAVPPEQVDVNVHPQKHEVRFREGDFNSRLYRSLRQGLAAARGFADASGDRVEALPSVAGGWQGLGRMGAEPENAREEWRLAGSTTADVVSDRIAEPSIAQLPATETIPLSGRDGVQRPFRILGQYKASLILVEGPDGLYLVDQHVAHERVLFERILLSMRDTEVQSQRLLTPLLLELSVAEAEALGDANAVLETAGFEYEVMSANTLTVSATPASLSAGQASEFLLGVARSGLQGEALGARLREVLAASLSCRSAVKMHDVLGAEELERLIGELFAAENPYACPHGRPVMLKMSDEALEKSFHRR